MPPRRGGEAGAGAQVVLGSARAAFEPPPLKRMHPWQQDGAGQCDILAGGVDDSGVFKGIYLTGVHMMALLRTFQLSKAFMPVDLVTPVMSLGQSLLDGVPLVVVTRGCFGRAKDYGAGPVRNEAQKSVWTTCRQMRADMPQVLITCIDIPINCSPDIVQECLKEPLRDYRELMYHEGTWYTPALINASSLAKFKAERRKEKSGAKKEGSINFSRKKFAWVNEDQFYSDIYTISWKAVLEVKTPPAVQRRTDLDFTTNQAPEAKPIEDAAPSAALATLRKALVMAREAGNAKQMLDSIRSYMDRAKWWETAGMEEAIAACAETADMLKADPPEAAKATEMAVGACIYTNKVSKAMELATALKSAASSPQVKVKASKLIVDCHHVLGDLDKALEEAKQAKAAVAGSGDAEAVAAAHGLVVGACLATGSAEEAVAAATEATKAPAKAAQAKGWLLLAEAHAYTAQQDDAPSTAWAEVTQAQKTARGLFKELGQSKDEAEALRGAVGSLLEGGQFAQALLLAKELEAFSTEGETKAMSAVGSQLVASAHLHKFQKTGTFLDGGADAMLAAAKLAVAGFDDLGDVIRRGAAQQTLREAIRAATKSS